MRANAHKIPRRVERAHNAMSESPLHNRCLFCARIMAAPKFMAISNLNQSQIMLLLQQCSSPIFILCSCQCLYFMCGTGGQIKKNPSDVHICSPSKWSYVYHLIFLGTSVASRQKSRLSPMLHFNMPFRLVPCMVGVQVGRYNPLSGKRGQKGWNVWIPRLNIESDSSENHN